MEVGQTKILPRAGKDNKASPGNRWVPPGRRSTAPRNTEIRLQREQEPLPGSPGGVPVLSPQQREAVPEL